MNGTLLRLQQWLYSFTVRAYGLGIYLAAPFNKKAKKWVSGRRGWKHELRANLSPGVSDKPTYWFHCASLGEFEQGRPVMEGIRAKFPDCRILLSFFSPSGYEIRKNYPVADHVFYLPLDTQRNATALIDLIRPDYLILVKYELWLLLLLEAHKRRIKLYLISALFRPGHWALRNRLAREMLGKFTRIFVQDAPSLELLTNLGLENTRISGDCRVDRVLELARSPKPLPLIQAFLQEDKPVLVAGSTWPPDEDLLTQTLREPGLKEWQIILAPHDISEAHLRRIELKWPRPIQRYSRLAEVEKGSADILLDTIGDLNSAYQFGTLAYIGGGFGKGIHNTLEPAAYLLPVFFGPHYQKFTEAVHFVDNGAAFTPNSPEELAELIRSFKSSDKQEKAQKAISRFLTQQAGASILVLEELSEQTE